MSNFKLIALVFILSSCAAFQTNSEIEDPKTISQQALSLKQTIEKELSLADTLSHQTITNFNLISEDNTFYCPCKVTLKKYSNITDLDYVDKVYDFQVYTFKVGIRPKNYLKLFNDTLVEKIDLFRKEMSSNSKNQSRY